MSEAAPQLADEAAELPPRDWRWVVRAALPVILFGIIAADPLSLVWKRWTNEADYYSHGPLIPFVVAYLVLRKKKALTGENPPETGALYAGGIGALVLYYVFSDFEWDKRWLFAILCGASAVYLFHSLRRLKPEPWKPGLVVLVPSLVLCVISSTSEIVSVSWFFLLTTLVGLVLYYLGKRVALILAFPLVFLFSSAPMPEFLVQRVTMPLKQAATTNAAWLLKNGMGIYCEREGAVILLPNQEDLVGEPKKLTVGAVCSGLRSLIALISFGLLFAYITPLSMTKRTILFAATIPASFVANLARILALALVAWKWDLSAATGDGLWQAMENGWTSSLVPHLRKLSNEPVHDFTGIMIFVVAFVGLFSLERFLTYIERRQRAGSPEPEGPAERDGGEVSDA